MDASSSSRSSKKEYKSSKKRNHAREDGDGKLSHKKHKHSSKHPKEHPSKDVNGLMLVDEEDAGDIWVEKDITHGGEHVLASDIPTADSLKLNYNISHIQKGAQEPSAPVVTETKLKRDDWMLMDSAEAVSTPSAPPKSFRAVNPDKDTLLTEGYGEPEDGKRTLGGGVDFFSSLGVEHKKKKPERLDPERQPTISSRELNVQVKEGKSIDEYTAPTAPKKIIFGGPGSQWRMRKLQRVHETAEEDERSVEEVARERYDNLQDFEEAKAERSYIDQRDARRSNGAAGGPGGDRAPLPSGRQMDSSASSLAPGEKRWMFTDLSTPESRPSSRNSFRRPGANSDSAPSTPQPSGSGWNANNSTPGTPGSSTPVASNRRVDVLKGRPSFGPNTGTSSPIPSVLAPASILARRGPGASERKRAMSPSSLNKLQARVLKARLMGSGDAAELEKQYEEERRRSDEASASGESVGHNDRVEMVPTLDSRGRLYDIGSGKNEPQAEQRPGNRKPKEKYVETRDSKTGEVLRFNADDDSTTLGDMLRQERFGAGMADQKNLDAELARAITADVKFEDDLEYMDDNADKLGRKKMRTDAMKRQFAINDYAKTRKIMSSCPFCYGEDDSPPNAPIVAMGTRAFLACTTTEELVEGHCYIVPIQHHLCMLEGDDDVWDEVRNFMKCLIRMSADAGNGIIFFETVINLKWQKHAFIECLPVPLKQFDELPAYFRESILASEAEWSQHKKLIDFSNRPGGFRRAMVPNLPYFMVQWDYKGEKGYGHVIEGVGDSAGGGEEAEGMVDEGDRGGGEFPRYFAAEIIGNLLDLEPRRWRRPRKMDFRLNNDRINRFKKSYSKYDWTGMLSRQ